MTTAARDLRILEALEAADALLRAAGDRPAALERRVRRLERALRGMMERQRAGGEGVRGGDDELRSEPRGAPELAGAGQSDLGVGRLDVVSRRLHPGRTHKASSAESILRHCLRRLGLTAAWRKGELTGRQRLELLAEVREYSRAWLRHEAEQLVRHYGRAGDGTAAHPRRQDGPVHPRSLADGRDPGGIRRGDGADDAAGEAVGPIDRALAGRLRHRARDFFARVRGFVKEAIVAGAMALSGPELDDEDHAEVNRQHAAQVAFLDNFEADVRARTPGALAEPSGAALVEPMTARQFVARAEMYGGAAWVAAHAVDRAAVLRGGHAVAEARFHLLPDPEGHACAVCLGESRKGWQPVGTLLPVGDSICFGIMCDCYFSYKLADGSIFITARGWERAA